MEKAKTSFECTYSLIAFFVNRSLQHLIRIIAVAGYEWA